MLGSLLGGGAGRGGLSGILGGLLGGQGFEEDAALDALADMADSGEVDEMVATPIGAGLAARVIARAGIQRGGALGPRARRALYARIRRAERTLIAALVNIPGTVGRRLRLLRFIARASAAVMRRRRRVVAVRLIPAVVSRVAQRVVRTATARPSIGRVAPAVAARRTVVRRRIVQRARQTGQLQRARAVAARQRQQQRVRAVPLAARPRRPRTTRRLRRPV